MLWIVICGKSYFQYPSSCVSLNSKLILVAVNFSAKTVAPAIDFFLFYSPNSIEIDVNMLLCSSHIAD